MVKKQTNNPKRNKPQTKQRITRNQTTNQTRRPRKMLRVKSRPMFYANKAP